MRPALTALLAALSAIATVAAPAIADQNAPTNLANVTVVGLRLGMTSEEALPIIRARFAKVKVVHTVCAKDNAAALAAHRESAPARCVLGINAGSAIDLESGPGLQTVFIEDFPAQPGVVRLERIRYQLPTRTGTDTKAFSAELLARYGRPSAQNPDGSNGNITRYCNGMEIVKPDLLNPAGSQCLPDLGEFDATSDNTTVSSVAMPFPTNCNKTPATPTIIMETEASDGGTSHILLTNHDAFCAEAVTMAKFFGSVSTQKVAF